MDASNIELLISKGEEALLRKWTLRTGRGTARGLLEEVGEHSRRDRPQADRDCAAGRLLSTPDWREQRFSACRDSALHLAVRLNQERVARLFLAWGHPPAPTNALQETPLVLACDQGYFPIARLLAISPAYVRQTDAMGSSPLHHAAASGSTSCLLLLLTQEADVDCRDGNGDSPLHIAARNARTEAVKLLLDHGASIEATNNEGERAIHKAAAATGAEVLETLISRGAELSPEAASKRTPLWIAIRSGNLPAVEAFIKSGVVVTKAHIKTAKEASRIAVWRYLQSVWQTQGKVECTQENRVEESLANVTEELRREIAELHMQMSALRLPPLVDCRELMIGEKIGEGSYGEVFRGSWRGTEVAVKRLISEEMEREFVREAEILWKVRHPNVVLAMGMCEKPLAIIEEHVAQGALSTFLRRSKSPLSSSMVIAIALDIARAMNYLHHCSPPILHRDLNPTNCLLTSDFHVKVCDFGLARLNSSANVQTKSFGTVQYSAPEFISAQQFTAKSDVYSYGILLWELIHREVPFSNLQPVQVVYAVANSGRRPTFTVESSIRPLIERCWAQDPGQRPDFQSVIADLLSLSSI